MSEMIERVSRALARSVGGTVYHAQGERPEFQWQRVGAHSLDDYVETRWRHTTNEARAAIEAMREPTESMWAAGDDLVPFGSDVADPSAVYRAMIDEALKP